MTSATPEENPNRQLEEEMTRLREEVVQLKKDITALTQTLKGVAGSAGDSAAERLSEQAARARERLDKTYQEGAAAGRDMVDDVERRIVDNPLASLLAAAGIGFIVAKLLNLGGRR